MKLTTPWYDHIDKTAPLPEYPRPQLVRESYWNLNGVWEYAIGKKQMMGSCPDQMDGEILVPFSPETSLSGVVRQLQPDETLWYRRTFTLPEGFLKDRLFLHFGAVDQRSEVYINGQLVGESTSGYLPFSMDITELLRDGENLLAVRVEDPSDTSPNCRGKQRLDPKGIWYTAQSGIWQTVWMESVPQTYLTALKITPRYDDACVELQLGASAPANAHITILQNGDPIASAEGVCGEPLCISLPGFHPWSPEDPFLYDLEITVEEDHVKSYFGMRKFSVETGEDGYPRLFLNNKEYFHTGVLDQGYWPESLYTPPCDEAMVYDIECMKRMGFNMLRKHIKIEPLRWYYHCDRLGMLVWQDMMNGGAKYSPITISLPLITGVHKKDDRYRAFARQDAAAREQFLEELKGMISLLYNVTSICMWVPFNEGWGQFDAKKAVELILTMDETRTIDHASGWHDQGGGAFKSMHIYFKPIRIKADSRAQILTEFGGYNYQVKGHTYAEKDFGYKRLHSAEELLAALNHLYEKEVLPAKKKGLCAAVYTQLSDVETELNGLVTYDRRVEKLPAEEVKRLNDLLI